MRVCKRTTGDPLLQVFLKTYGLNLLSVPREDTDVGDLYVRTDGRISSPGSLTHFLTPKLKVPRATKGEQMATVTGKITNAISFSIGLSLLEGFFSAIGAVGLFGKVKSEYATAKTHSLRFSFNEALRDSLDVGLMGSKLIRHRFSKKHALVNPGNRYYLVTGVARSKSISVTAVTKSEDSVGLGVEVLKTAKAEGKVEIEKQSEGTYTYTGPKHLAFGVELYELTYDERNDKMKMLVPEGAIGVMAGAPEDRAPLLRPAFVETEDDDAFFDLE
jgi:hypothetical protein